MADASFLTRRAVPLAALVALSAIGVGCQKGASAVLCPPDSVLLDGRCQVACQRTGDCLSGELCIAGVCRNNGGPPDAQSIDTGEDGGEPPDLGLDDKGFADADAGEPPKPDAAPEDLGLIDVGPPPDGGTPKPNFRAEIRALNTTLRVADPVSVDVLLANDGFAPGPVDVALFLAPSAATDVNRAVRLTPIGSTSTRLTSGQQTMATFQARIPSGMVPTDELRFFVALDAMNLVDENDENDNLASQLVVVDALDWTPASITFPLSPLGCRVSRGVRMTNLGVNRVELSNVRVTGAAFAFDGQSSGAIDPGGVGMFSVAFRPLAAGATAGSLDFDYSGGAGRLNGAVALSGDAIERHVETFTQGSSRKLDLAIFVDEGSAPAAASARQRAVDQVPSLLQALMPFDYRVMVYAAQSGAQRGAPVTAQTAMPEQALVSLIAPSGMISAQPRYLEFAATSLRGALRADAWLALVFVGRDDDTADTVSSLITRVRNDPGLMGVAEPTVVSAIAPARAGLLLDITPLACAGLGGASRLAQFTAAYGGLLDDLCGDPLDGLSDLGGEAGLGSIVGLPFRFGPPSLRFDAMAAMSVVANGVSLTASQFVVDVPGQSVLLTRDVVPAPGDPVDVSFVPVCVP
jgi:hypothetical protein